MIIKTLPRSICCVKALLLSFSLRSLAIGAALAGMLSVNDASALEVRRDLGGSVNARLSELQKLRSSREQVRIVGTCVSACTLYLGLPNTCVSRSATLGFHGPRAATRGLPLPQTEFERVSAIMATHYPVPLRRWFMEEGRMRLEGYYEINGAQVIQMGARECP